MRRRFVIYILSILCAFIALGLALLYLFGIIDPAGHSIERTLNQQLENSVSDMEHDIDELAAYGIEFSHQMGGLLERKLSELGLSFDELAGNGNALSEIQSEAYAVVYTNIQLAPCSGAFYMLNSTAGASAEEAAYSSLYLKFANLYSENTVHNKVCLFRGYANAARKYEINLHSSWQPEAEADLFADLKQLMQSTYDNPDKYYLLTSTYRLADTWENARFLCVPMADAYGRTIGVCGFEISDLYFQLSYEASEKELPYMVCGLLDAVKGGYTGQLSANKSGYLPVETDEALRTSSDDGFIVFENRDVAFVGKAQEIIIGQSKHAAAAMLPRDKYDAIVRDQLIKTVAILLLVMLAAVGTCIWLSKRYVHPILTGLEDIKSDYEQQLSHLADKKKQEIDPDCYALFLSGLDTLTPKEREIFRLYADGRSTREIQELANINQNTLKYHNKNIYSKLGVSSRKELLTYTAVMKREEGNDIP